MSTPNKEIILFVHQSAELYGSDRVLLYLVSGIEAGAEFKPVVLLPETGPLHDALIAAGVEVHVGEVAKVSRAMFSPKGLLRLMKNLSASVRSIDQLLAGRRAVVVHSNTLAVLGGAVWSIRRRVKHIWHVHEIILTPKLIGRAFPRLVNVMSDRAMSNSTLTERWLLGVQPKLRKRSVVVFNGLPDIHQPDLKDIEQFRKRIHAGDDDIVVALVGRLHRWKGQSLLVDAAARLLQRGQLGNLRFAIVGDPAPGQEDIRDQLTAQANAAGVGDRFTFLPFMKDIAPVWFGSDIAVVPSTHPESFGMVAIEAMAASLPVIGAEHGGMLDIVEHEKTGLFVKPGDVDEFANAIHRLASDKGERMRLGDAGAKRQRQLFSVKSQVEHTQRIYKELIAS